jgi:hypothetical protein
MFGYIQSAQVNTSGTSATVSFSSNTGPGHAVVVAGRITAPTPTASCTDSQSNTYIHPAGIYNSTGTMQTDIFVTANTSAAANTVTYASSVTGAIRVAIHEYAGLVTSNSAIVDPTGTASAHDGGGAGNTAPSSGSTTTTNGYCVLFGAIALNNGTATFTPGNMGTGYAATVRQSIADRLLTEDSVTLAPGAGSYKADGKLSTADNWSALFVALVAQTSVPLYPLSEAEIALIPGGLIVVNYEYPPCYVDRYGTNAPGLTPPPDMSGAFSSAIAVAKQSGGTVRYGATAPYTTTNPINATSSPKQNIYGLTIVNDAGPGIGFVGPSIIGNHTGHVFDLTGTMGAVFERVSITSGTNPPQTAFFQSRVSFNAGGDQPSVGITRFMNCTVSGSFSKACYYNYAAEDDLIIGGYWQNTYSGGTAAVIVWTANNSKALTFTGGLTSGATSATLTSVWFYPSGQYLVTFTDVGTGLLETRTATLAQNSTLITWSTPLTSNVTAAAAAQFCMSTYQTVATGTQSCINHQIFGGDYFNQSFEGQVFSLEQSDSVKIYNIWCACFGSFPITFTGGLASGATSGTLTSNWIFQSINYFVTFTDVGTGLLETRTAMFTHGATGVTWSPGLTNAVISSALATVGSGALVEADTTWNSSNYVVLDGITGEENGGLGNGGKQGTAISVSNPPSGTITLSNWGVQNCKFPVSANVLSSGTNVTFSNLNWKNVADPDAGGIVIQGTVFRSTMDVGAVALDIATSKDNALIGYTENFTITTRSNDNWIDTGVSNKSWSPVIAAGNHGGMLTIDETRCLFSGNMVYVEFCMHDSASITFTAGQTVSGLPKAALNRSAAVSVANATTGVTIGSGFIQSGASTISMPAFTVGGSVKVCVSASYFVA